MNILGFICFGEHDSAACLVRDGEIIAATEEERYTRIKYDSSFPVHSIEFCLRKGGLKISDIDLVCYSWLKSDYQLHKKLIHMLKYFPQSLKLLKYRDAVSRKNDAENVFRDTFGYAGRFQHMNHHLCHAANVFYLSPFEQGSILSLDGMGDWASCWMGTGEKNQITPSKEVFWPHSLGNYYSALTQYLGFKMHSDEYKVMGLSAYGKDAYKKEFEDVLKIRPGGGYKLNLSYFNFHVGGKQKFSDKFADTFGAPATPGEKLSDRHADIACSAQKRLEEVVLNTADHLYENGGSENLMITGGVGLNCVANGRLLREGKFKNIFVGPSCHDSGTAVGAALLGYFSSGNKARGKIDASGYWGESFDDQRVETALNAKGLKPTRVDDIARTCAELLKDGKIIAWFQGRSEFGPRALGNRSFLANPTIKEMKEIINVKIKKREEFRPFAPSILREHMEAYFGEDYASPYMTLVFNIKDEKREELPAVVHVDGTCRVQSVSKEDNARYYELIEHFYKLTGTPVILNTSFNIQEPIVNTPEEAVACFLKTDVDYLAIHDYLVARNK
ncbi:MAG: carbamoyl transferase [Candidatus Nitrohelix vancouverensis]|uniref:Carbamoyl transferase n=1 Tax=Candidatus Nitrohelix vancouverensis TaxID=2705534 RepID=A0A7T0C2I7_9BACT|nr:MAG: carbamoyl transferase [Candidatus Nitrohelix vancouverensis]